MTDYISKKGIQKALIDLPADLDAKTVQRCIEAVHNFPAADVRENLHGRWKPLDLTWGRSYYFCSVCGQTIDMPTAMGIPLYRFCPNCGAIMKGGEDES